MIKDCLDIFQKELKKNGDSLIFDSYILSEGSYIIVKKDGTFRIAMEIDKKNKNEYHQDYVYVAKRDYLSRLIDMNKPIDTKKQIHSNNYCTFFVKKEVVKDKLTDEIIEGYFNVFKDPAKKYISNKKLIYLEIESELGVVSEEKINWNCDWIKKNIKIVLNSVKNSKDYLKIFFEEDIEVFEIESKRYLIPNIFNSNDYNIKLGNQTYGLPNDNMGLNSKKPYLGHKTRKEKVPVLLNIEDVLLQKKFFDYIYNFACEGKYNIYFDNEKFYAVSDKEIFLKDKNSFEGWYLRIKKGKEVEIHDQDIVNYSSKSFSEFKVKNILNIDYAGKEPELNYSNYNDLESVSGMINKIYFNKFLSNSYYSDSKDIRLNDSKIKECLLLSRKAFCDWFYKGNENAVKQLINKITLVLIKNAILQEHFFRAREQFNLRFALLEYFKLGGVNMGDKLASINNSLREKINSKNTNIIDSDDEYYFAVGQLLGYLLSLNKSYKKSHSLINPIINSNSIEKIEDSLKRIYIKYNYAISDNNTRVKNLYAMIIGYLPENKVNNDFIIAGYLYSNLVYEKKLNNNKLEGENNYE